MSYNSLPDNLDINASALNGGNGEDTTNDEHSQSIDTAPDNIMADSRVLNPMSAWAGSATIINLVLATGPFAYPFAFVKSGFIVSVTLMLITMTIAYMTATFMIEAVSVC